MWRLRGCRIRLISRLNTLWLHMYWDHTIQYFQGLVLQNNIMWLIFVDCYYCSLYLIVSRWSIDNGFFKTCKNAIFRYKFLTVHGKYSVLWIRQISSYLFWQRIMDLQTITIGNKIPKFIITTNIIPIHLYLATSNRIKIVFFYNCFYNPWRFVKVLVFQVKSKIRLFIIL